IVRTASSTATSVAVTRSRPSLAVMSAAPTLRRASSSACSTAPIATRVTGRSSAADDVTDRLLTEVPAGFPILWQDRAGEESMKQIWLLGMVLTLALSGVASAADSPTFSDEVVRIVQERCQTCHRPGEHAPFSLITYADVFTRRADIRDQIDWRTMPPWKPVPGFGSFLESRRLSDEERATILKWIDAGAPEGDRAKLPPPRVFATGWTLGSPDHVLEMSAPSTVPARAGDVYRCFVVPTSFPEDRWVSKVEYAPSDRKVVHHVLAYIDTGSAAQALHRGAGGSGYPCFGGPGFLPAGGLGGWAPGVGPREQPDGVAWLLPAGATVVLQVHYNNGSPQARTDRTRVALYFAQAPVDKRHRSIMVLNHTFTIPAGEKRQEVH